MLTFVRSLYNLFVLDGNTYFDSMSGIVFFMLIGRWAQDKTQRSLLFDRDYKSFFPVAVNVLKNGVAEPVLIGNLNEKDIIEVYDQEIVPADALLSKGKALIDYSFVTGESLPRMVEAGSLIYAGGKQLGERIELVVIKKTDQGYLTNLWNREARTETDNNQLLHKASNYFTLVVFALTFTAALYWLLKGEYNTMLNALTTTLIVACPCALLLAATFTNGNVMRILSRAGLFLKNADVITRMARINHVVFDKTGTITQSKSFKINYKGRKLTGEETMWVASLLKQSTHPLSKAILGFLKQKNLLQIEHFLNAPGKGIEGWIDNRYIKIGSGYFVQADYNKTDDNNASRVFIWIDGVTIGCFELENIYRNGLDAMMQRIRHSFKLSILSGDNNAEYGRLKNMMGEKADIHFNQSPENKYDYISKLQAGGAVVLMAGDGLNDSGALRKSDVGIAVMEGHGSLTPASDGIISAVAFTHLDQMLAFAALAKRIVVVSFIVSVLYNIIGLYFALQGLLQPVVAAILMPASTISIILITFLMAEYFGRKLKSIKPD